MISESTKPFKPDYAVHPGESVKELQEHLGLSFEEMAEKLIMNESLKLLYEGKLDITQGLAYKLGKLSKTSPSFWLNLQGNYDRHVERPERENKNT